MPTIKDGMLIQLVTFDVAPGKQDELISALVSQAEDWICLCPGFVSSTFHASLDGRHVLNYAQWRSEADLEAFARDPRSAGLSAAVKAVGPESGPHATRYHVVRAIEPGGHDR